MNYNAEILEGIWYLIIAILRTSFPYILIMLGYQAVRKMLEQTR